MDWCAYKKQLPNQQQKYQCERGLASLQQHNFLPSSCCCVLWSQNRVIYHPAEVPQRSMEDILKHLTAARFPRTLLL